MKNIGTFIGFSISKRGLFATVLPFLYVVALVAQPSVLYTGLSSTTPAPSNSRYTLNTVGGFRQYRFQANQSVSASSTGWAFHAGTTASPNYSPCWRPTNASNTLSSNTFIPTSFANGALYQSSGGGNDGLLPAITSGSYYTFNVAANASASNNMALLETTYSPVTLSAVSQASGTYGSRTVTITTSGTPNSGEYIFVRYSTNSYSTSTLVQATGSSTTWTVTIPWQSAAVSFYVYTSNRTLASINSDVTTYGQVVHDMSTLNLNNNSGSNYSWTPATGAIIVSSAAGTFATPIGYTSLTNASGAFAALNTAASGTGAVTVLITADVTNEAGTNALNNSTNWTSMTINPSGVRTISSTTGVSGAPMIDFNGADNVTINGLNDGTNSLTISNTSTSATNNTSTIRLYNAALTNTITNCTILGSYTGAASNITTTLGGTIFFSTGTNNTNTISNCNIGPAGSTLPTRGIFSLTGTNTTTISNNNIYDYFKADSTSAGIYLGAGSTDWTISGNKFYQQASRTQTTGAQHSAIWVAAGNNYTISGNTIGYATSSSTGNYTFVGTTSSVFIPMFLTLGTTTASNVQGNTITAIAMSGSQAAQGASASFRGIAITAGLVNVGTTTANTIGSLAATGSITYTSSSASASDVVGINIGASTCTASQNIIGGITVGNTNATPAASNIFGIRCTGGTVTLSNNVIGGTIANSLQSTSTAAATFINGIFNNGAILTITGNTIRNLTTVGGTGTFNNASIIGISVGSNTAHTISQNTIHSLSNTLSSGTTTVTGILINNGTTISVSKNSIHSLSAASATSILNGIYASANGTANPTNGTYTNNMIRLGIDASGSSLTAGMTINGIYESKGTNNFYFNSVYIGGSGVVSSLSTYAFYSNVLDSTRNIRNNIFYNARSNTSGVGKNYAVRIAGASSNPTGLTLNYNLYFANGTGAVLGNFSSGGDKADIALWRTAVGQDANSVSVAPVFATPTGTSSTVDLHLTKTGGNNCTIKGIGTTGTGITDDYDGDTRDGTQLGIGADEFGVKVAVTAISGTTPACTSTVLTPTTTPTTGLTYAWGNPTAIGGATSGTYTVTITGSYNVTITETSSGCAGSAASPSAITINPLPTITLGSNPSVCRGITAANLPYSATTNSPNQYSITYNAAAITAGFVNVSNTTLPTTPIVLTVPAAATVATYNATLTVTNTTTGCVSAASNITATINALPTIALASQVNDPCQVGVGSITVTITGGTSPYSVAACGNYISPSPSAPALITVPTVNTSTSTATVPNLQGNATYKLTVTDANTCTSQ